MAERVVRVVASLLLIGLLAGAVWWVASRSQDREQPSGGPDIPGGPRFTLASGRFDQGRWGDYQDQSWRLVVWGNDVTHCFRLEIGEPQGKQGISCSGTPRGRPSDEHILARMYDPGGGNGGKVKSITVGALSQTVARLEFQLRKGDVTDVLVTEPLRSPAEAGLDERFYVVFLPAAPGRLIAYDASGHMLDKKPLCDRDCQHYLARVAQS